MQSVFDDFYEEILKDKNLSKYFQDPSVIPNLINRQMDYLVEALSMSEKEIIAHYKDVGDFHYDLGLPLFDIVNGINFIRDRFFQKLAAKNLLNKNYNELNEVFANILQSISYSYLIKEAQKLKKHYQSELTNTIFYRVHIRWIISLLDYLVLNHTKTPIELEYENSIFKKWIDKPEIGIIIKDKEDKEEIEHMHKDINNISQSLSYHTRQGKFYESLGLLHSLSKESLSVMNILNKKALLHFRTKEEGFFAYIKEKKENIKKSHLSILKVKSIDMIHKYKGLDVSDEVINEVEKRIKSYFVGLDENIIFVRSQNGVFYIFYDEIDKKYLYKIQKSLKSFIENDYISLGEENVEQIKVSLIISTILFSEVSSINFLEQMLHYSANEAMKNDKEIYYLKREEESKIFAIIESSQKNIKFVHNSLKTDKLVVFYQPVIDLNSEQVYDVEALARIKDREILMAAGTFIDLIHELEIIVELDIKILKKIKSDFKKLKDVTRRLFVNLSPVSLRSKEYIETMIEFNLDARSQGIVPCFELTEQSFLENLELIRQIHKENDIVFAVDDFGTGYSSLRTVAELSEDGIIDYIKLDGSLIKNIISSKKTYQVVDAICQMSSKLELKVIAEYIETTELQESVRSLGINLGQGYLYSKALGIDDLVAQFGK